MSAAQQMEHAKVVDIAGTESRGSLTPLLPEDGSASAGPAQASSEIDSEETSGGAENGTRARKRDFWKLGKKSEDDKAKGKAKAPSMPRPSAAHIAPIATLRPVSPLRSVDNVRASASPQRSQPYGAPSSPGQGLYSSSPRLHSPASSQIFERNVQEDVLPPQASPQIPSHIITENHIPAALDASSAAITNEKLDPDSVEIVTHATHQPASVTITGTAPEQSMSSSFFHDDLGHSQRYDGDNASNYGTIDNADVRRLSFISFADVVHAEQADMGDQLSTRRDSANVTGMSAHSGLAAPRSPSPVRSPGSSHGLGTSPPTSVSPSFRGLESSPSHGLRGPGSPLPGQISPLGGELNIETMRQALRKTRSGDLGGQPMSAVGHDDEAFHDKDFK